jgi:hypothetical protein
VTAFLWVCQSDLLLVLRNPKSERGSIFLIVHSSMTIDPEIASRCELEVAIAVKWHPADISSGGKRI